jgi:hypothetical protein
MCILYWIPADPRDASKPNHHPRLKTLKTIFTADESGNNRKENQKSKIKNRGLELENEKNSFFLQ